MELKDIQNLEMLSEYLGTNREFFSLFLSTSQVVCQKSDNAETRKKSSYIRTLLPKKNIKFGHRTVYQVNDGKILNAQKGLQGRLNRLYRVPDCVHGFVHGKSISTNAAAHLAKKSILKIDIRNFFESITAAQVAAVFQRLGCTAEMSAALAKLVTLDGKLVQGFVTSPVIANLVVVSMDEKLNSLCAAHGFDYTRYADDITISSNTTTPDVNLIKPVIEAHGFKLNDEKTLVMLRGKRQYVTGLTVFDDRYPRISKKVKRNMRQQLHYLKLYGAIDVTLHTSGLTWKEYERDDDVRDGIEITAMKDFRELKGRIDYINAVEPILAAKLYGEFFEGIDRPDRVSEILQSPYDY